MRKNKRSRSVLTCEQLESRLVLSNSNPMPAPDLGQLDDAGAYHAVIVAGDPNGTPTDSPSLRVDGNTHTSPFAGVGSLRVNTTSATYICTATPYDSTHVLSAGHCLDINNDGKVNSKDGILSVIFQLNQDTDVPTDLVDVSIAAAASSYRTHPDYTGFGRPSVNDDLSVITLSTPLPQDVPTYPLYTSPLVAGSTRLIMVGYGRSGNGLDGYTVGPSFTVKRSGENMVDAFYGQDDRRKPAANEVFRFDFDGPSGNGSFGGPTLGNDVETTLGGGDSGGPSFVLDGNVYKLAGVNTFTQGSAPFFGSLGGGMVVPTYANWILTGSTAQGGAGSGGGGGGQPSGNVLIDVIPVAFVQTSGTSTTEAPADASVDTAGNSQNDAEDGAGLAPLLDESLASYPDSTPVVAVGLAANWEGYQDSREERHDDILKAFDAVLEEMPPIMESLG